MRQHCSPYSALLHEIPAAKLGDAGENLGSGLADQATQAGDLGLVASDGLAIEREDQRTSLRYEQQLAVVLVPLLKQPPEKTVVS
ncbi:MAG: hypothetical protein E5X53_27025 [Mesorhizobium sp.]|uniref:hypothetical protein n=1 Tax=Mesorhizobium sp. TaxID=1871066 RepID=UPI00120A4732|nr:hypothetical protein [Mesorhizobium sp.]TIR48895.1 MAG: hypothetical protein E5X53_27025 [Mesorhizobium sp.]